MQLDQAHKTRSFAHSAGQEKYKLAIMHALVLTINQKWTCHQFAYYKAAAAFRIDCTSTTTDGYGTFGSVRPPRTVPAPGDSR